MVPLPVRMGLKELRHKREIEELHKRLAYKEKKSMVGKVLWYAFWAWTAYVTLAYFGILDAARPYINIFLESFQKVMHLTYYGIFN